MARGCRGRSAHPTVDPRPPGGDARGAQVRWSFAAERARRKSQSRSRPGPPTLTEIHADLAEAPRLQALATGKSPIVAGLTFASFWHPVATVGGDLLLYEVRPRGLRVLPVDTTGHRTQAALRTVVAKTAFDRRSQGADATRPARIP